MSSRYVRSGSAAGICVSSSAPTSWLRPVMPGRAVKTSRCNGWDMSTKRGSSGLGPTNLISPRATFQSWGSSSRCVRRNSRPIRVMRGSEAVVIADPALGRVDIVRSLKQVKSRPLSPTLVAAYMAGPGLSSFTATASAPTMGRARTAPRRPRARWRRSGMRLGTSRGNGPADDTAAFGPAGRAAQASWPRATCSPNPRAE